MPFFNLPSSGSGGGTTLLSGNGAPSSTLGSDGAFYVDLTGRILYGPKTAGAWGTGIALTGADWAEITSKPTAFAPSLHAHTVSDVTGLQTALDGKQASGSFAASVHSHTIANVTGLQTELDGKQLAGSYAATVHAHAIADVTGLQTALDGKQTSGSYAASAHAHSIASVTGLQTALDGKQASGSYAAATHSHVVGDVAGLQTALDGKQVAGSYAAATHSHVIGDVTGLQTAIDGKQASGNYATLVSSLVPVANLPLATKTTAGVGIVGGGLTVASGTVSVEVAPGAPTGITDGGGTLSWTASTTGTSSAYDVQQTFDTGATYTTYFSNVSGTSVGNFDPSRKFRVRAKNSAGLIGPWGYQSGLVAQVEAKNLTIGSGFSTTDGTLTVSGGGSSYTLPIATASVLGGVKAGTNVTIAADGTISAASGGGSYTLPEASASVLGGVKVGSGLSISSGVLSATGGGSYTLPVATASVLGGVKQGTNITIAADGTISTGAVTLSISDIAGLQAALDDLSARIGGGGSTATITISSQPSAQTASSGAATFSVTASVSPSATLSYQWERQALGTGSYSNVSGATSATLSLTGLTNAANNADNYRVVVSATGATSVTSNAAALTVASASLLSISRNNGTSTFTGSGTTGSPFTRATSLALDAADGLSRYSWTANASATVTLVFSYRDNDSSGEIYQIKRTRSGSTATQAQGTDGTAISVNVSVISGDVISFSSAGYPPAQFFSSVSVSAA